MQGVAEIFRCIVCIKTGEWTPRIKDADEIDVVEQQLANSTLVDPEAALQAIANAKNIEEYAHQRATGGQALAIPPSVFLCFPFLTSAYPPVPKSEFSWSMLYSSKNFEEAPGDENSVLA